MKNILLIFVLFLIICIYYLKKKDISKLIENLEDEDEDENYDEDYDPMKSDYTKLIKSVNEMGFNSKGTYKGFKKNVKASKRILTGIFDKQTDVVSGNRAIGTKLVYNTGFKCNDNNGTEQELYTYLDNSGNPKNGLFTEIGSSTGKIFNKAGELLSASKGLVDDGCTELKLKIITNSGKDDTKKVHIQNSEISSINKSNIIENFSNISHENELLMYTKTLFQDKGIFIYLFGLSGLFLYFLFKLMKKNN